jgi:hypothetical protein
MLVSAYVSMSLTACPHIQFSPNVGYVGGPETQRDKTTTPVSHLKSVCIILHVGSWISPPRDLRAHKIFLDFIRHNKNCLLLLITINLIEYIY